MHAPHRRRRRRSTKARDVWWHELIEDRATTRPSPAASRWTPRISSTCSTRPARPRSRRESCTRPRGYLVGVATTHHYIFDIKPDSVYWCAADVGWVTGHSYIVYGPLCERRRPASSTRACPNYPTADRWWEIVERYKVDILYTAPTAIRSHMKWGPEHAAEARPLVAAPARHRSASRSIPRPGSGTASTSAATARRSSTPGGRPRRG